MKFPVFKRKFAFSMYKDLRLGLGKMTFAKDFVNDSRGDLYPVSEKSPDCREEEKESSEKILTAIKNLQAENNAERTDR